MATLSDGVRIRTPSSGFGDRLLSQELTAEILECCGSTQPSIDRGNRLTNAEPLSS